jgi:hypothetical protein
MATVSVLAVGDTFTAAVENDIANQLNQMHAFMTLINPNTSTAGSGTATWVTMGNVTVPTWATKGRVCLAITGFSGTAANASDIAVKIGTSTGQANRITSAVTTTRQAFPLNDLLTSVPTGSQSVTVQSTFLTLGTLSAPSTACVFALNIDWLA